MVPTKSYIGSNAMGESSQVYFLVSVCARDGRIFFLQSQRLRDCMQLCTSRLVPASFCYIAFDLVLFSEPGQSKTIIS